MGAKTVCNLHCFTVFIKNLWFSGFRFDWLMENSISVCTFHYKEADFCCMFVFLVTSMYTWKQNHNQKDKLYTVSWSGCNVLARTAEGTLQ